MKNSSDLAIGVRLDGEEMALPIDAATARIVTLGKSGAGKTNSDAVLAEMFIAAGVPTIVLDPLGNMWGLRSNGAGDGPGLPIAIFGGSHGDVPLPEHRAVYLADFAAEGVSCVFDMSHLPPEAHVEFAKAFLSRLLQRAQTNLHVVLEEADRFAPQRAVSSPVTMFSRASRNMGIGWTFSTQKPQVLHKEVIDSANVFIAMKMTGELAQEAIGGEIASRIGKKAAARMILDLPSFKRGEAWFVPDADWLGTDAEEWEPTRMRFKLRDTFEVRPPKVGEQRREPKILAAVDLELLRNALSDELEPDVDDVEVEDLRSRIVELEARLAIVPEPIKVEIAAVSEAMADELSAMVDEAKEAAAGITEAADRIAVALARATGAVASVEIAPSDTAQGADPRHPPVDGTAQIRAGKTREESRAVDVPALPRSPKNLGAGPMKILESLAGYRDGRATRIQLGMLSGFAPSGGTFAKYLGILKAEQLVDVFGGDIVIKPGGRAIVKVDAVATSSQIVELWHAKLKGGPRKMFIILARLYPKAVSRADLGLRSGYESSGGTFAKYLGSLKSADFVHVDGNGVRAADALFPTGPLK